MDWVIEGNGLGGTQEVRKIEPCEQLSRAFTMAKFELRGISCTVRGTSTDEFAL